MFILQLIWPSSRLLSPIGSLLTLNNWIKTKYGYLITYTWVIKCAWHSKHLCIWSIIHIVVYNLRKNQMSILDGGFRQVNARLRVTRGRRFRGNQIKTNPENSAARADTEHTAGLRAQLLKLSILERLIILSNTLSYHNYLLRKC